ncbi:hypothetical protein [Metallibacterium sp.]|uniref:hypothetical protein n=1 Tax=Metallibacterium sp. TaxID=2940281 RepID=UPI002605DC06|nr:hypothetical protein [Metallibacterium sp.]
MCKELTAWRNGSETPWLADAPIHPLQQTLKDLERAYTNFFAKQAAFSPAWNAASRTTPMWSGAINILRAGYAPCACEVSGAVMPPAAGTHRGGLVRDNS